MTNPKQHRGWISTMHLRAAGAALTLAVVLGLGLVTTESAQAQTYRVLHSFDGTDGANPFGGLLIDKMGNLYGTADKGGAYGYGTVYELNKKNVLTLLYSFCPYGGECTDGANPAGGLIRDALGTLYGTTTDGGSFNYGVVFKLESSGGIETVLHSFAGGTMDGCNPSGSLLQDKTGNLYGITGFCGAFGNGTVFKLDTAGTETVLHSFTGVDGTIPIGGLIMDSHGNLYGVAVEGGVSHNCYGGAKPGCGVVYKLSKNGLFAPLHYFTGGTTDGCYPEGTPIIDKKDNLYGTAEECGSSDDGIVWKVSKQGAETVLHSFTGHPSDGAYPWAGVIMDKKGNLYGDTYIGGVFKRGTVYELSKSDTHTLLHSFNGYPSDGQYPNGGFSRDRKGNLYGTTLSGGSGNDGTVWQLTP